VKKTLSYADALRILGGEDGSSLGELGEALTKGTLSALGVPDVLGLHDRLIRHGQNAITGIREKLTGVSRWDRTERVAAADLILRITAFFDALAELLEQHHCPFTLRDLRFTRDEQYRLFSDVLRGIEQDTPTLPPTSGGPELATPYRKAAGVLLLFLRGLEVWDRLDDAERTRVTETLEELPSRACRRHIELYRKLAADVPEFGVWANFSAHEKTQEQITEISTGLDELAQILQKLTTSRSRRRLTELENLYQAILDKPILDASEAPNGVVLPSVRDAYLDLGGLLRFTDENATPSSEAWWHEATRYDNLQPLLASLLTQRECLLRPIVLLGHPGAGKSQLTRMLAARLPLGNFLPLRVELRSVPADAPIHTQIDEGISATLHARTSWRDLADEAQDALPVVILDGFDELLQATGVNRSDYLEQVQRFQEHQADLGRPVAVIVTSRTVVAERTRFPFGIPVIRLEPFTDAQIAHLTDVWNRANTAALAEQGLHPITADSLLRYRDLAEQPLLLFMLLIFDADANALQRETADLGRAGLYEKLLTSFAEREVRKHHPHLYGEELAQAVEDELRSLEVVAIAMFARHQQWVSAEQLEADLAALFPGAGVHAEETGLSGHITTSHQVLGRFFFVHEARAIQQGDTRSVYEFLHATFGEHLVARAVVNELARLVEDRAYYARRRAPLPENSDFLFYAFTSFAALAGRAAIVESAAELLAVKAADARERAAYRSLLVDMFREAPYPRPFPKRDYQPFKATITHRLAAYTANLVTLLVLIADEIDLSELFPDSGPPWLPWRELVGTWRSLPGDDWYGLLDTVRMRHLGHWGEDETPRALLCREQRTPVNVGECVGFELRVNASGRLEITNPYRLTVPYPNETSRMLRSVSLLMQGWSARLVLMVGPYLEHGGSTIGTWAMEEAVYSDPDEEEAEDAHLPIPVSWMPSSDILELRLGPCGVPETAASRLFRYQRILEWSLSRGFVLGRHEWAALRQAGEELAAIQDATTDPVFREVYQNLRVIIEAHLHRVEKVMPKRKLLEPVLETLRPHLNDPSVIDRILDLATS